jgi:hypothetical protein
MALNITGWTFDESVYNPGDTITMTVNYTSSDVTPDGNVDNPITVTVTDADSTQAVASVDATPFPNFTVSAEGTAEPTTVSAADTRTPLGVWTVVSNDLTPGTDAPFDGIAVLTSTA